jgi:hypothetical protein
MITDRRIASLRQLAVVVAITVVTLAVITVPVVTVTAPILPAVAIVALGSANFPATFAAFALVLATAIGTAQFPATLAHLLSHVAVVTPIRLSRCNAGHQAQRSRGYTDDKFTHALFLCLVNEDMVPAIG